MLVVYVWHFNFLESEMQLQSTPDKAWFSYAADAPATWPPVQLRILFRYENRSSRQHCSSQSLPAACLRSWLKFNFAGMYGRPFVSKLWHDIRAVFSHVYLKSFLLHDIRAFFCHVTCVLCPSIWPFSYKRAYICAQKNPSMRYKQTCGICGRGKLSYKIELKSNFSLNQAWPQCPR